MCKIFLKYIISKRLTFFPPLNLSIYSFFGGFSLVIGHLRRLTHDIVALWTVWTSGNVSAVEMFCANIRIQRSCIFFLFFFYSRFSDICLEAFCCYNIFFNSFFPPLSLFSYSPLLSKDKVRDFLWKCL